MSKKLKDLIHNASLEHDDLVKQTENKEVDIETAIRYSKKIEDLENYIEDCEIYLAELTYNKNE